MPKSSKSPVALPPPVSAEEAIAAIAHEFEVVAGPDMSVFADRVKQVQQVIQEKRVAVQRFLLTKQTDIAYDMIEIGWILLQGKAAIDHGMSGKTNAAKNETDTVSDPISGFGKWVAETFAEINERTARRYMNAARNMKLSADSTLEDVHALRAANALGDRRLTDLYLPPRGEEELVDAEQDAEVARRNAEAATFEESIVNLTQLGIEKRAFALMPKPRLKVLEGQVIELRKAIGEALKA